MLQRRLTTVAAAVLLGSVAMAGCGATPIDDPLVKPGITAIDESSQLACGTDAATLRAAIDAFTIFEGAPPASEADLVPDYLREESSSWDVVDGVLVAENPACGDVGSAAPTPTAVEIVTSVAPLTSDDLAALTPEAFLADLTPDQIDAIGGLACASELAELYAAGEAYIAATQELPSSIDQLVAGGYLDAAPEQWTITGSEPTPVDGSGCASPEFPSG